MTNPLHMKLRNLVLSSLLVVTAAPINAHAADPVVASGGGAEPGWVAQLITTDGSKFSTTYDFSVAELPVMAGTLFYAADNSFLGGSWYTVFTYRNEVEVHVEVTGPIEHHISQPGDGHGYSQPVVVTSQLQGTKEAPKTYKMVSWTAGDTSTLPTWTMRAPEGVTLGASTTGNKTYLLAATDFDAVAKASVQGTAPRVPDVIPTGFGPGGHAVVTGRKVIDVEGVFVGTWSSTQLPIVVGGGSLYGVNVHRSTVTDASGVQRDCTLICSFYDYNAPLGMGPGRYTFEHTGAGAGVGPFGTTYLWGMDIRLPE